MGEMSQYLFSFGPLATESVQLSVLGRTLDGAPDAAAGFRASGTDQLALVPTHDMSDRVPGSVFEVTDDDIAAIDAYETDRAERTSLTLESGVTAWVYLPLAEVSGERITDAEAPANDETLSESRSNEAAALKSAAPGEKPTLWNLTARELADQTASAAPTPGGGSVAAISGALGASLIRMAIAITAKKTESAELSSIAERLDAASETIALGADEDVAMFDELMAAYRLPKETEHEKAERQCVIEAAAVKATRAPLRAATAMVDAMEVASEARDAAARNVVSDVFAGVDLLAGAVRAALHTVDINLPQLSDDDRATYQRERDDVANRAVAAQAAAQPTNIR